MSKKLHAIAVLFVPIAFFIIGFITLKDYGINWDEPIHFNRGQGYLYYFLTGKTVQDEPITENSSFFQGYDVQDLYDWDGGHPVTSDILASASNLIFHQKLGVVGDIEGYHLYNVFVSAIAVLIVSVFAYKKYGVFASVVAGLVFATYPLFFAESHFNIKDPPQTAFFTLAIFTFWMSLKKPDWRWLLVSALSCGLALGTKFNIVFLPFILGPYLVIRYFNYLKTKPKKLVSTLLVLPRPYLLILLFFPFIAFAVFYFSWPYLWADPVKNILHVLLYYKNIATGFDYQPGKYLVYQFNLYPVFWILVTTPLLVIFLTTTGIFYSLFKDDNSKTNKLWLLWFIVPIGRVMLPGTSIYGGVRQIMEFLPAMALLAGVGANFIIKVISNQTRNKILQKVTLTVFVFFTFYFSIFPAIRLHPNQNVYFNMLVGGLKGAKEKNIPSWGNSYGNAYWPSIKWLNANAEKGAKIALVQGTGQNVPLMQLRSDLQFSGTNWSGINRDGEYLMELIYEGSQRAYPYVWDYIESFLDPVYEIKADGVAIAKVWKNDITHTKPAMRRSEVKTNGNMKWSNEALFIDLKKVKELTRLTIQPKETHGCNESGGVELSIDGENWGMEREKFGTEQVLPEYDKDTGSVNYYLPARNAQFIKITFSKNSCFDSTSRVGIYTL